MFLLVLILLLVFIKCLWTSWAKILHCWLYSMAVFFSRVRLLAVGISQNSYCTVPLLSPVSAPAIQTEKSNVGHLSPGKSCGFPTVNCMSFSMLLNTDWRTLLDLTLSGRSSSLSYSSRSLLNSSSATSVHLTSFFIRLFSSLMSSTNMFIRHTFTELLTRIAVTSWLHLTILLNS